jgi:hypothetical protein
MFLMAELWDSKTGEILATATVNLNDKDAVNSLCEPGCVSQLSGPIGYRLQRIITPGPISISYRLALFMMRVYPLLHLE